MSAPIHGWWIRQSQMTNDTVWPRCFSSCHYHLCVLHRTQSREVPLQDRNKRWGASNNELWENILWRVPNLFITVCCLFFKIKQKTYLVTKATKILPTFSHPWKRGRKHLGMLSNAYFKIYSRHDQLLFFKLLLPRQFFFYPQPRQLQRSLPAEDILLRLQQMA